ncbi:MAG: Arc family DNA-binding protein [Acetanaerobacterium sp.]
MMPSNLPQFTIRIDPVLLEKLRYVAEYNARSANREVELLIRRHVEAFEREHGQFNTKQ